MCHMMRVILGYCALTSGQCLAADALLLTNANGYTGNPAQPRAEAVLVIDGRIAYSGPNAEAAPPVLQHPAQHCVSVSRVARRDARAGRNTRMAHRLRHRPE